MFLMGQSAPTIQEFGGLNALTHPGAITAGPDGALWFTEVEILAGSQPVEL
jgi:hypothetical protein